MTLQLDHVTFKDGPDTHIHDVSLTLVRGRLHVLLGPTLSGKTILMRLMAGLEKPTSRPAAAVRRARQAASGDERGKAG